MIREARTARVHRAAMGERKKVRFGGVEEIQLLFIDELPMCSWGVRPVAVGNFPPMM